VTQPRIDARDLQRALPGSMRRHQSLEEGVLAWCALYRLPAIAVHTGPRVRPREGGGFDLIANPKQRGLADVLVCLPPRGRFVHLELKTGKGRRSPEQVARHRQLAGAGALSLVVRTITDLEPLLDHVRGPRTTPEAR
jgi:hypothetical protein